MLFKIYFKLKPLFILKSYFSEHCLIEDKEDTTEDHQKYLNKIRAKRNRKRKKNFYEDLESR